MDLGGIISLKCFHGLPFGSLRKNLAFNMIPSLLMIDLSKTCSFGPLHGEGD
jgi:hypothetical protein